MKTSENGVWIYASNAEGIPENNPMFVYFINGETTDDEVIDRLTLDSNGQVFFKKDVVDRIRLIELIFRNTLAYKLGYLDYEINYQLLCLSFWSNNDKSILPNAEILARFIGFNSYVKFNKDLDRIEVVIF